jgi:hypothetical protein
MRARTRGVAAIVALAVAALVAGCSGGGATASAPSATATPGTSASTTTPSATGSASTGSASTSPTVWLCKPGAKPDPCDHGLSTTTYSPSIAKTGTSTPKRTASPRPACFYVYPTVSEETTQYSDLTIQKPERQVAAEQAGRWSQRCDVWAPMYRQLTLSAIGASLENASTADAALTIPVADVTQAFREFLAQLPAGQPFVVVAHSQGAIVMRKVLADTVDKDASIRSRMLSAMLLGGNVLVKTGTVSGGDFTNIPGCTSEDQTGCVIAYSTFGETPPDGTELGVTDEPGMSVLCTNPAKLDGSGTASPIYAAWGIGPSGSAPGLPATKSDWQSVPHQFRARCDDGDADALILSSRKGSTVPSPSPNTLSGLHDLDANLLLGNLLTLEQHQDAAWQRAN